MGLRGQGGKRHSKRGGAARRLLLVLRRGERRKAQGARRLARMRRSSAQALAHHRAQRALKNMGPSRKVRDSFAPSQARLASTRRGNERQRARGSSGRGARDPTQAVRARILGAFWVAAKLACSPQTKPPKLDRARTRTRAKAHPTGAPRRPVEADLARRAGSTAVVPLARPRRRARLGAAAERRWAEPRSPVAGRTRPTRQPRGKCRPTVAWRHRLWSAQVVGVPGSSLGGVDYSSRRTRATQTSMPVSC